MSEFTTATKADYLTTRHRARRNLPLSLQSTRPKDNSENVVGHFLISLYRLEAHPFVVDYPLPLPAPCKARIDDRA